MRGIVVGTVPAVVLWVLLALGAMWALGWKHGTPEAVPRSTLAQQANSP